MSKIRDPERTRARVLNAARQEFANKGLAGARVDVIARRAKVNKQALYYHFGSKEDLFREALEEGYRRFREHDPEFDLVSGTAAEALTRIIGQVFDDLHHAPDMIAMIMEENRHKGSHINPERVRAINAPLVHSLGKILQRGVQEGTFRPGIDPGQFYLSVMSLLMFGFSNVYTLSAVLGRDLTTEKAMRERRAHILDLLLKAVRK